MTDDDKANMKYKAEKCFKVLGFTKAENVSASVLVKMSLCMRKPTVYICENKGTDQRLCFCYTVQSIFFLIPKIQAFSHFQRLYRPVCVRPGRKPKLLVFSCTDSNVLRFCPLIITIYATFCCFFF